MNHRWQSRGRLVEPEISDKDGGAWARYRAVCERCGEVRRVWTGIGLGQLDRSGCKLEYRMKYLLWKRRNQ